MAGLPVQTVHQEHRSFAVLPAALCLVAARAIGPMDVDSALFDRTTP